MNSYRSRDKGPDPSDDKGPDPSEMPSFPLTIKIIKNERK